MAINEGTETPTLQKLDRAWRIEMFIADDDATTFAAIVAGGGANNIPVYCDGTNWRIG